MPTQADHPNIHSLLGLHPSSPLLIQFLQFLANEMTPVPIPKIYPDAVYFNYYTLGLSLLFIPQPGFKPNPTRKLSEYDNDKLVLDSIYLYNTPPKLVNATAGSGVIGRAEQAFSAFALLPLELELAVDNKNKDGNVVTRPQKVEITREGSGKDFVRVLGEPDRKGGGVGPTSGSIGIWCEWTQNGIMVEFGGEEAIGPGAWERGKDAVWKTITLFAPQGNI
ncbi:hypothetical protein AMATHDRAFT_44593 [Amanita thiersii Skay4041]|uniref:Uncharacterized protein n=1 Tax=Amanita thiersii Skay4041 TaxID=703135 RepID=A0A2A9NW46_9AGAR|nr:hypothetical protein AMATHDRAFT_44593 [Amanita thiersii Skay4041]